MVSAINMTGLGVTLSTLIVSIGGEKLFLITLIVAVVCMVMGMGIPTTASYVLVAAVLAPTLIKVGIVPLVAQPIRILLRDTFGHNAAGLYRRFRGSGDCRCSLGRFGKICPEAWSGHLL